MNNRNKTWTLVTAGVAALALAGCSSAPKQTEPAPAPAPKAAPAPAPAKKAPPPAPAPAPQPDYVIEGVQFELESATLKPEARATLDAAAMELKKQPGVMYEVSGYTDTTGPEAFNQTLSEQRAMSVKEYLVGQGVPASQLNAKGYGEANPAASNSTREGRMKNRRVEIWPAK